MSLTPLARPWWVLAAALGAGLLLWLTPLNTSLSRGLLDLQLRLLAPSQPNTSAVVFDIDDASLRALKTQLGPWPFKRDVYALAIEQLRDLGAQAIAIDLLLADAQPGDAALARAIARPGAPVVLAAAGLSHAQDGSSWPTTPRPGLAPTTPTHSWSAWALPSPSVWPPGSWPRLGVITTPLDDDGVLRRLPLWHASGGLPLPVLALAAHDAAHGQARAHAAQLDTQGALHLAMPSRAAAVPVRPFSELMAVAQGEWPAARLRPAVQGRVVFIGSSALLSDAVMTVSGQSSGVEVLAQAYSALHDGSWVHPPLKWADGLLMLLAAIPAAWVVRRGRASPRHDALFTAAALVLLAAAALLTLSLWRLPTAWAAPLATLLAGLLCAQLSHQHRQHQAQRVLGQALAVAAETARLKGAFLATVSHEVRTPLNAMLGVAELLDDGPLLPNQKRHVQILRESGQALLALINDLLDLAKIESGKLGLDTEAFSLHHLLEHLVALMRPRAEEKGLRLQLSMANDLPDGVLGDRARLQQSLMNLLGNAIKFTPQGEVSLHAKAVAGAQGQLSFEVSDTGIGIAPSKLETIFEPFAQADNSVTRKFGGTGLGLSITRSVAQVLGGSVQVRSTPGLGSVFTLQLPLPQAVLPLRLEAAPTSAPPQVCSPMAVLLAEDNEVNVYLFQAMIEGQPIRLDLASNGHSALALLRQRRYDLAFMDIQMPGLDGLSVTRELRLLEIASQRRRTPVVALTANAFASDVQASLAAGCDRHLAKPFTKAQLLDALLVLPGTAGHGVPATDNDNVVVNSPAVLDEPAALQRLAGDRALYERLALHAQVFIQDWSPSFERACVELDRGRGLGQAQQLARDLSSIATGLGAHALADAAAALEATLQPGAAVKRPDPAVLTQVHLATLLVLEALLRRTPPA